MVQSVAGFVPWFSLSGLRSLVQSFAGFVPEVQSFAGFVPCIKGGAKPLLCSVFRGLRSSSGVVPLRLLGALWNLAGLGAYTVGRGE